VCDKLGHGPVGWEVVEASAFFSSWKYLSISAGYSLQAAGPLVPFPFSGACQETGTCLAAFLRARMGCLHRKEHAGTVSRVDEDVRNITVRQQRHVVRHIWHKCRTKLEFRQGGMAGIMVLHHCSY